MEMWLRNMQKVSKAAIFLSIFKLGCGFISFILDMCITLWYKDIREKKMTMHWRAEPLGQNQSQGPAKSKCPQGAGVGMRG